MRTVQMIAPASMPCLSDDSTRPGLAEPGVDRYYDDITPELARRSGFDGVVDLLKVAKQGTGGQVYLIEFSLR